MNIRIYSVLFFFMCTSGLVGRPKTLAEYRAWFTTVKELTPFKVTHNVAQMAITDPDFSAYFDAREPGFFRWFGLRLGLIKKPWDLSDLNAPLERIIEIYVREKSAKKHIDVSLKKGDKVIIFGNLHGSIFSFIRDLGELERRGLINNQLEIASGCHIIFLGDIVNYSPHTFEMLDIIIALLEKNKERAIYICNEQEKDSFWFNLSAMRYPLEQWQRLWGNLVYADNRMPLVKSINDFFALLPDSVALHCPADKETYILCSGTEPNISQQQAQSVAAVIMGERWAQTKWDRKGLEFFGFTAFGNAIWSILSCPNRFYQDVMRFNYDSFVVFDVTDSAYKIVLESVSRDIRTRDAFTSNFYSLVFGFAMEKNSDILDRPSINIGSTVTLSGAVGAVGRGIKQGIEAAFMRVNREGGVNGEFIHPIVFDDTYIPRVARRNVDFFKTRYGSDIFVGPQGTPTLTAYFDRVRAGDYYVFFPSTGGAQFRLADVPHIIHYRKTYPQEVASLVDHICKSYDSKRFAIIYQDDAFGQQLAQAARDQLTKRGISAWVDIPFANNNPLLDNMSKKLLNSGAEAIGFFFTSNTLAQAFLNKVGGNFLIGKHLFAISFLDDSLFRGYLELHGLKFTFSYAVPNPFKDDLQIVREFRQIMQLNHRDIDSNSLEGYIAAALFIEGARHVTLPLSGEKIMRWLESLKNYPFKGFTLTFNPETRSFELPTWIRTEKDQWVSV